MDVEEREVFGGAASVLVPRSFVDMSHSGDLPGNQEMFCDKGSERAMMVEINDAYDGEEEPVTHYLNDLAEVYGASRTELLGPAEELPRARREGAVQTQRSIAVGVQHLEAGEEVAVCIGLVRFPEKKSDVLIAWLLPNEEASAAPRDLFRRVCASFQAQDELFEG
jgi:hypothetical protein